MADENAHHQNSGVKKAGVVAIGRNEGERLRRCLTAARATGAPCIYVDSQSTDDSLQIARALGADSIELDVSQGFTAAMARNAGFRRLMETHPDLDYVQFVDGDCELVAGWMQTAIARLEADPTLAAVAGRRRERFPHTTIFNALCDMEWNTPVGPANAIGGDALYRTEALKKVNGFDDSFICGEEPELCRRLRISGWRIERLDAEMTLHDAAITRWDQWWKRATRSGWAYGEGAHKFGALDDLPGERYNVKQVRSIWIWGAVFPLLILGSALMAMMGFGFFKPIAFAGLLAYPLMGAKIALGRIKSRGDTAGSALLYGAMTMLGKFPQLAGVLKYTRAKNQKQRPRIIEYKSTDPSPPPAQEPS